MRFRTARRGLCEVTSARDTFLVTTARLSSCERYRYRLERRWAKTPLLTFVMLNPSTADEVVNDPTIRRCMGFARREDAGGIVVVNLFGLRSSNPAALSRVNDPFGSENEIALMEAGRDAASWKMPIVAAWGVNSIRGASLIAMNRLTATGALLLCLGKTKHGFPRHPLYVRADQPLEPFP